MWLGTESESVISNKTSPSIDINASVTKFSSKLISKNEKQNNNKDSMVTSIDSSEKCVTEPSLIVETDRHVNQMFNKPNKLINTMLSLNFTQFKF